jgi:hypothetical protein
MGNYAIGEELFAEKFNRLKFREYQGDTRYALSITITCTG